METATNKLVYRIDHLPDQSGPAVEALITQIPQWSIHNRLQDYTVENRSPHVTKVELIGHFEVWHTSAILNGVAGYNRTEIVFPKP